MVPVELISDAARESMEGMKAELTRKSREYGRLVDMTREKHAELKSSYKAAVNTLQQIRDAQVSSTYQKFDLDTSSMRFLLPHEI